jgi:hypothetical protein
MCRSDCFGRCPFFVTAARDDSRISVISDPGLPFCNLDWSLTIWKISLSFGNQEHLLLHLELVTFPARSTRKSRRNRKEKKKIIQLYKTAIFMPKALGNWINLQGPLPSNLIS